MVPTASCICGQRLEQAHRVQDPRLHQSSGGNGKTTRFHWKLVETSCPAWLVVLRLWTGVKLTSLPAPSLTGIVAWPDLSPVVTMLENPVFGTRRHHSLLFHLVHATTYPSLDLERPRRFHFLPHLMVFRKDLVLCLSPCPLSWGSSSMRLFYNR